MDVNKIMTELERRYPGEKEYHQAVYELLISIEEIYNQYPYFEKHSVIERLIEPDRVLIFKVPWTDDAGKIHINRGFRVQFNNALGPYKGGLRFHPSVNLSIMKFLAFEQVFKNSLTTLALGGAKGGSDFNPKGKSDTEIMRFCQSFMLGLWEHIGPETDIPAGDIGVGTREIGYLYGMYKKLTHRHNGTITGKGIDWGGSLLRPEATGYGVVYFINEMLATQKDNIEGKTITVSGFGNVAWGVVKKATEMGAKVVTLSGPDGYVYDPAGVKGEKIDFMLELRASNDDMVEPYARRFPKAQYFAGRKPWEVPCDIAIPCATQNELDANDASQLVKNGCRCVCEAANMPCTPEAIEIFQQASILYAPGKAANAGGVATSGLEMSQNAMKLSWSANEVDARLHHIMQNIHQNCLKYGMEANGYINYLKGANIAGFLKVAHALIEQGV
ncbi:MAG: NADP-specific glutamate dehydrogenase [Bacteroidales bacterium]